MGVLYYYNHQTAIAYTTDSDVNIQFSRVRKYQWCRCFCTLAWLTVIFNGLVLAGRELLLSEDDENWIWGLFYYNKNDSRFCVDKKVGIGFTTNMAKPAAMVLTVGILVFTVVLCIGAGVFCAVEEFTPVKLEYENHQITAIHWKEEYQIHKNAIG